MKALVASRNFKIAAIGIVMAAVLLFLTGCSSGLYQSLRKDSSDVEVPSEINVYVGDLDKNYLTDWYSNETTKTMAEVMPVWTYVIDQGDHKIFTLPDDYRNDDETTRSVQKGDIVIKQPVSLEIYTEDAELDYDVVKIGHVQDASTFVSELPWKCEISLRYLDNEGSQLEKVLSE